MGPSRRRAQRGTVRAQRAGAGGRWGHAPPHPEAGFLSHSQHPERLWSGQRERVPTLGTASAQTDTRWWRERL